MAIDFPAPKAVNQFEYDLLRIATAILSDAPITPSIQAVLASGCERPKCLSATTLELLQERIAKGVVSFFAQRGWTADAYLRDKAILRGPVWKRTPPQNLGLTFSPVTVQFLMDLTADELLSTISWKCPLPMTLGDRVFLFLATRAINEHVRFSKLWKSQTLGANGAIALMYPDKWSETVTSEPDFEAWLEEPGPALLECLQADLANRWIAIEKSKSLNQSKDEALQIGSNQTRTLNAYLDALESSQRWDLAKFLLRTMQATIRPDVTSANWIGNLDMGSTRLMERAQTYDAAASVLIASRRLRKWHEQSQGVGYFDEGYQASQLWKTYWEQYGAETRMEQVEAILKEIHF